tara:strand:- start:524 stop:1438 length:915 start_codon:yes stop_codon:yes gene_type:complete
MKKNSISVKFNDKNYNFIYKRNYYGFRGEEKKLEDIKIVLIGGSTADERYKPYEYTITGLLNKRLDREMNKEIINAGIEGQSTRGHIYNFEKWFPRLKGFNPNYFIFYIGMNDHLKDPNDDEKTIVGHVSNPTFSELLKDNIKSRSIFYDYVRKIKHKYYVNEKKTVSYDFDFGIKNYTQKGFDFLDYDKAIKIYDIPKLKEDNKDKIEFYLSNVDKLVDHAKKYNAKPIFINQLAHNGNHNKTLFILNYSLIEHCEKKKYNCIDLAKFLIGKKEYWWDGVHTTPTGSQEIVKIIYPKLLEFLK